MQSNSFTSHSSIAIRKSKWVSPSLFRFNPISISFTLTSPLLPSRNAVSDSSSSRRFLYTSTKGWITSPSPVPERNSGDGLVMVRAAENAAEIETSGSVANTLQLCVLFVLWFLFNIYFNIYNKQVLKVYPFPVTVSTVQFAIGTLLVIIMWTFNLYKRPKISGAQLVAILPMALVHTLGNLFTNMSLGNVSVSFTHTVKAMEPFFSVVLSAMFLGEMPTLLTVISLLPIVGGIVLASMTEVSFNWIGFWSAMASNLANQSRNVLSKKIMSKKEESMDNITLFSIITVMSFLLLAPVSVLMEGIKVTPAYLQSVGLDVREVYIRSLLAGICFHAYQQVAYMILERVSPVTHSVANSVKRVIVIVASVLFFRTPVSLINSFGTGIALAGVFFYSRVKGLKPKPKTT